MTQETMTQEKKENIRNYAISWYFDRGIMAYRWEDTLLIKVQEFEIEISESEMYYRANLHQEEIGENCDEFRDWDYGKEFRAGKS